MIAVALHLTPKMNLFISVKSAKESSWTISGWADVGLSN